MRQPILPPAPNRAMVILSLINKSVRLLWTPSSGWRRILGGFVRRSNFGQSRHFRFAQSALEEMHLVNFSVKAIQPRLALVIGIATDKKGILILKNERPRA